jgi:hypothetical protein
MTRTPTIPIPAANAATTERHGCDDDDDLTAICEQVQGYADSYRLYFDDEDRDNIDKALDALLERLRVWGEPVPVAPRCRRWRVRDDEDRASGSRR